MKNKPFDEKSLRFMKLVFDRAKESFDSKDIDFVAAQIDRRLTALPTSERREAVKSLRRICRTLEVDTRAGRKEDFVRIMTGASYWSYLLMAFAMVLAFDKDSRRSSWAKVEKISSLQIEDLAKISSFFDAMRPKTLVRSNRMRHPQPS